MAYRAQIPHAEAPDRQHWLAALLAVLCLLLAVGGGYYYFSPRFAFAQLVGAIRNEDVDGLATRIDIHSLRASLKNRMHLDLQDALRAYPTKPDVARVSSRFLPYFESRSRALVTPASILRELGAQLNPIDTEPQLHFLGLSRARVSWSSRGEAHAVLLEHDRLGWRLAGMAFPDAMPRFWDHPAELKGVYYQAEDAGGAEAYTLLSLADAIDILDVSDNAYEDTTLLGVTRARIGADTTQLLGLSTGDEITVSCRLLRFGYAPQPAERALCVAATIRRTGTPGPSLL